MGKRIEQTSQILKNYRDAAAEVVAETLWPTRCVLCGNLGHVLCEACSKKLPFIDQVRSCPQCGASFGQYQCCECNSYSLKSLGRKKLPFDSCVSALRFTDETARIVRTRKDFDERRLVRFMAYTIACAIPSAWVSPSAVVVPVPTTIAALHRRGFDHALELAEEIGSLLHLPTMKLLKVAKTADQRGLGRASRAANVAGSFTFLEADVPERVILVDDVYTTGSTVMAATDALRQSGVQHVFVATFARV